MRCRNNFHLKLSSRTKIPEHGYWETSKYDERLGFVCQVPRPQSNCIQNEMDKEFADQGMNSIILTVMNASVSVTLTTTHNGLIALSTK